MRIEPLPSAVTAPPGDDPGDPALVELIRSEIAATGPITFARFMELALYEPRLGYYATSAKRPTRSGDFLTAPELHPVFGWTVANQIYEMWSRLGRPDPLVMREYGAGRGTLGAAVREGLAQAGSALTAAIAYEAIDLEHRNRRMSPARFIGCVIANEFLDALPVHLLVRDGGRLREIFVGWRAGRFAEVVGDVSDPALEEVVDSADPPLPDGKRAEVSLAASAWLSEVAGALERGFVLIVDYALPEAELYAGRRATGTLRAFRGHHVSSDVLAGVGRQDITAHVNLDALARSARSAGLDVLGVTSQAEFLLGAGLEDVYQRAREGADQDWKSALELRSAVRRLLDPRALGGYKVVVLGKGVRAEPPLRGLAYRAARPS